MPLDEASQSRDAEPGGSKRSAPSPWGRAFRQRARHVCGRALQLAAGREERTGRFVFGDPWRAHPSSRVGRTATRGLGDALLPSLVAAAAPRPLATERLGDRLPAIANFAMTPRAGSETSKRASPFVRADLGQVGRPPRNGRVRASLRAVIGAIECREARVSGPPTAVPPMADDASRVWSTPSFASLDGVQAEARRCHAARRAVAVTRCAPARHGRGAAFQTGSKSMIDGTRSRCFDRFRGVGGAGSAECEAVCR